ncbi:unannotated protein [freshwater metagenome]|uniref:Unannotated protein n=1 Tax=freshwater metagenome TaxID=449393 RepID=A0A6J6KRK3_9ZZZZ
MVHVTLASDIAKRVDHLLHAGHAERGDVENLGLATLEQTGTMNGRKDADLGRKGTNVLGSTTIDTSTFVHDA